MSIAENLAEIRARISAAERRAGRPPDSVALVAVSKLQPVEAIREAYAAGQRLFGENYAQELRDKARELADLPELRFHFIGSLQRNKARYVVSAAARFEALDDLGVAAELDRRLAERAETLSVLVEVNCDEAQKGGVAIPALDAFIEGLAAFPRLRLDGLMAIPPEGEPEQTRPYFQRLARLAAERRLQTVSMGMSGDFEQAIEEGATHVRVGTAIFGRRPARGLSPT